MWWKGGNHCQMLEIMALWLSFMSRVGVLRWAANMALILGNLDQLIAYYATSAHQYYAPFTVYA